jgi:hypothetical protein
MYQYQFYKNSRVSIEHYVTVMCFRILTLLVSFNDKEIELIDDINIKNTTITANAAKHDNQRYCYEDPYSERKINLISEGLEP